LNDGFRFEEIVRFKFWKTKVVDGGGNERGVFRRDLDEKVNVLRKTRQAVVGDSIPSNEQILNLPGV
jgi:hypothetical protein